MVAFASLSIHPFMREIVEWLVTPMPRDSSTEGCPVQEVFLKASAEVFPGRPILLDSLQEENQLTFRQTDNHHHCTYHDRHRVAFPLIGGGRRRSADELFWRDTKYSHSVQKNLEMEDQLNGRLLSWWNTYVHFSATIHDDDDDNCNTYVKKDPCIHIPTTIMYNLQKNAAASNTWQLPSLPLRFQT